MKTKIFPLLACLLLAVSFALAGCGDSFSKIKVNGTQSYDYTVHSQGGMAVQYGNYVYFINGYAGYDDTDGKQNLWPDVVKGGLYRAELSGKAEKDTNGNATGEFTVEKTPDAVLTGMEFVVSAGVGYDGNATDVVNVQQIAPKRIGTSGYNQGGIFIYDEWVYFATPNNEKDKSGTVQITKTDFFRARLDGTDVQKIYTTENADNATKPYAFYKYAGAVYLVAQDGTDVVSVKMSKKPGNKVRIAQNVTNVLLPYSQTYYAGMNENTLEHFVYVLRAATDDDYQRSGNIIEIMRPDGTQGGVIHSQGKTDDTLESVRNGLLFYRTANTSKQTEIHYTNLHDVLMGDHGDAGYKAYHQTLAEYVDENCEFKAGVTEAQQQEYRLNAREQMSGVLGSAAIADYTATYCFRPGGERSDMVYMLGVSSSKIELRSSLDNGATTIYEGEATLLAVEGEYVYFKADNLIYRTKWLAPSAAEQISESSVSESAPYNGDYCAGYIVYVGSADEFASDYTLFKQVDRVDGMESVFAGVKVSGDIFGVPEISMKKGVISWGASTNAASYNVYNSVDGVVTLVSEKQSETSYTIADGQTGEFWVCAVSSGGLVGTKSNIVRA